MIDVASIDDGLKRSGVDDDGSSRRDVGGLSHEHALRGSCAEMQ
jgi:hypothetical protein